MKKNYICLEHQKVFECFCKYEKCNKNECDECYNVCYNNPEHDQLKSFKRFKEDFINSIFEKYNKNELDKKNIKKNSRPAYPC